MPQPGTSGSQVARLCEGLVRYSVVRCFETRHLQARRGKMFLAQEQRFLDFAGTCLSGGASGCSDEFWHFNTLYEGVNASCSYFRFGMSTFNIAPKSGFGPHGRIIGAPERLTLVLVLSLLASFLTTGQDCEALHCKALLEATSTTTPTNRRDNAKLGTDKCNY